MIWARKRSTSRVIAAVLFLSTIPMLLVPTSRAVGGAQYGTYERWIRAQIRVPVDAAVEHAISAALESDAKSFDAFIVAFLDAYAKEAPDRPLSQVFTDRDLSNDALISFLQRRYSQVAEEGVLPRVYLTSLVQSLTYSGSEKSGLADGIISVSRRAISELLGSRADFIDRMVVLAFRTISSARPLGP